MRGLAIVGTDTGVGKTVVTAAVHLALLRAGIRALPWKPVGSGGQRLAGRWISADVLWWKRVLRLKEIASELNPYCERLPLSPWVAARLAGRSLGVDRGAIMAAWERARRGGPVLVEGVGGVLVPLRRRLLVVDLIRSFRIPALIVGRAGLGTINHLLLTIEALRARNIPLAGIILNGARRGDLASRTNPDAVRALTRVPVLAVLPWQPAIRTDRVALAVWARRIPGAGLKRAMA